MTVKDKPEGRMWAAFLGREDIALGGPNGPARPTPDLSRATARNAVDEITEAARGRRVVFLNENHFASRHRSFLAQVLRALRAEGFDVLAGETFYNGARAADRVEGLASSAKVGFGHGTYIWDPVLAETVREALDLGYRLTAYENTTPLRELPADRRIAVREAAQAANLATALAASPRSRFVVYVGFSHLRETPDARGNLWLARRLRDLTGIDPLTVHQATTGSFGPDGKDSPTASAVMATFRPQHPIVVRTVEGQALDAAAEGADLTVFHPPLDPVAGRPGWLAADPKRKQATITWRTEETDGLLLAQACHADSEGPTIPADQYLADERAKTLTFFLRPGRYVVRTETLRGVRRITSLRV